MLLAKFAHSSEVWNSADFNKSCESTEREAEDSNPLRVNMGAFAPVVEYKTYDPSQLPGSVYKIDSISGVALILVVITCMSQATTTKPACANASAVS
jgi:TATA-box binding protein (TBP), component of TFIID and TFIIIB